MDETEIKHVVEAALLAAGRPLTLDKLNDLFAAKGSGGPDRATLKRALEAEAHYAIDERELRPGAPGFTFDSVSSLKGENPQDRFTLIMGADQYEKRDTWHRWADIENLCDVAVCARPGSNPQGKAKTIPMNPMAISASDIRGRLGRGEDVSAMLPAPVLAYIRAHGLYR